MKTKITFMLLFALMLSLQLKSQDIPPPNPSMTISIVSGYAIVFNFNQIDYYKNGIMNAGQSTFIRVGAIMDWKLQFNADQDMFYGENDPSNQMQLNNVGLVVVSTGTNLDDGSNIINYAKTVPVALESEAVTILTKGSLTNKGYGIKNAFTLNWEMGTQRGNMLNQSILEQMIEADTYTVNIILTLSAY